MVLLNFLKTDYLVDKPNIRLRTRAIILLRISVAGRNKDLTHVSRFLKWTPDTVSFRLFHWKTQQRNPRRFSEWFEVRKLPNSQLYRCAYSALKEYIDGFSSHLSELPPDCLSLWLHYRDARPVRSETLARDQTALLRAAGIPPPFGSASIRSAVISFWCSRGVSLQDSMKRSGHMSERIVCLFYDKSASKKDLMATLIEDSSDEEVDSVPDLPIPVTDTDHPCYSFSPIPERSNTSLPS